MGFLNKLANTIRPQRVQAEVADELAFHLEERTRANRQAGMTEEQARLAAQRQVGTVTRLQDETIDTDVVQWLDALRRDTQLALRTIRKSPLFAAVTILSLTLGIGANTMVFTVMKHLLVDSLPVPNANRLVILHPIGVTEGHTSDDGNHSNFSYPQYQEIAGATHSIFSGVLASLTARVTLEREGSSERATCELVSGNYFPVLGVEPWRGRLFTAADNQKPGAHPLVVLGYGNWQRTFGGDPSIVGQTVRINRNPYTVIGIAPPNFYGLRIDLPADVYVPMMMKAQVTPTWDGLHDRLDHWATVMAALQPGVSMARAQAALAVIFPPLRDIELSSIKSPSREFRREFAKNHIELTAGGKGYANIRSRLEKPLQFVGVMVLVVLLITVVNIANLLIARSATREREMAVRLSIGAGKAAVIRQVLVESLLLALGGGVPGVALAYVATPVLFRLLSDNLSQSSIDAHPDTAILLAMAAISVLAAIGFGLLPAWQSAKTDPALALKSEGATGHAGGKLWLRRCLVGSQIVFSMVLLTGALLFTSSLAKLQNINPGFPTDHVVTFKVDPSSAGYEQIRIPVFTEDLLARLRALPQMTQAAVANMAILEDDEWGNSITVEGESHQESHEDEVLRNLVSPGYFETLQIPLMRGRLFTDTDEHSKLVVVNSAFVKEFIPGQNPIGRHLEFSGGNPKLTWTIVGLVADSQHLDIRENVKPFAWTLYQNGEKLRALTFYIRTADADQTVVKQVRAAVHAADPSLAVYDLRTLREVIASRLFVERGLAVLADGFAVLAIVLAAIGLYGVVSYSVTRRYREFGIRMAVGASPRNVLLIVLQETAFIGGISVALALPLILAGGGFVRSSLYGVQPNDPILCGSAALILLGVAFLASFIPAWEAASIDPQTALRNA